MCRSCRNLRNRWSIPCRCVRKPCGFEAQYGYQTWSRVSLHYIRIHLLRVFGYHRRFALSAGRHADIYHCALYRCSRNKDSRMRSSGKAHGYELERIDDDWCWYDSERRGRNDCGTYRLKPLQRHGSGNYRSSPFSRALSTWKRVIHRDCCGVSCYNNYCPADFQRNLLQKGEKRGVSLCG